MTTTTVTDLTAQQATALDLADRGLAVFPVDHPTLPNCAGRHHPDRPCDGGRGKHPEPRSWPAASTTDPQLVANAFSRGPRNIGVDAGKSGLVILDEDAHGEMRRLCGDHTAPLPDTFTVTTGKGAHWYFLQPPDVALGNGRGGLRAYRIDVRGRGGYVVGPGSLHATGRHYEIHNPAAVAALPTWILTLLRPAAHTQRNHDGPVTVRGVAAILQVTLDAGQGERNDRLFWSSCRIWERVRDGQLADPAAEAMLIDTASVVGLPAVEALATIRSARRTVTGT